jgi:formaldehyde-activating enzyme
VQGGDLEAARTLQRRVQKLSRIFCRYGGGVAVKQALRMMGVDAGRPRSPLKAVGGALLHEDRAEIQLELEKLGLIQYPPTQLRVPDQPLASRFESVGLSALHIASEGMRIGTASAGDGVEAVQIDLVCGAKDGPMGEAWAYQLTYPRHGFEALTTILEPNLTVRPSTLIVPSNELKDLRQANMIYGPVQNAVARAIIDKLADGVLPEHLVYTDLMFVQTSLHPQALDRRIVHRNTYKATCDALECAFTEVA